MEIRIALEVMYSKEFAQRIATALGTNPAAALLDTPVVKLIKDPGFSPSPGLVDADYDAVEADFTDYVAKALTISGAVNIGSQAVGADGTVSWLMTTDPTVIDNSVYGYWIEDAAGVVAAEMFEAGTQVAMATPGDQLILTVALPTRCFQSAV